MYIPEQWIIDIDREVVVNIGPNVWDRRAYPKNNTHIINQDGTIYLKKERPIVVKRGDKFVAVSNENIV